MNTKVENESLSALSDLQKELSPGAQEGLAELIGKVDP